jgi:hypothetical protein
MSVGTLIVLALIIIMIGVVPLWPYSKRWGYGPVIVAATLFLGLLYLIREGQL